MADNHPIGTAAATEAGLVEDTLLEAMRKRMALVLAVDESLGDFEFSSGEIPLAVIHAATGYVYFYDSTDSTTPDDGVTCLVTGNGLRYHIEDAAALSLNSVLSIETSPPGGPTVGDAHIVDTAATGDFSGHDDDIAFYTRRGWVFATPELGHTVFNADDETNWQYGAAGWGGFAVSYGAGSIPPEALEFPAMLVVQDTLDSPPGSPVAGQYWIVGSSPSGAFSGHAGDLARYTGSGWTFLDPEDGWAVSHAAYGFLVIYSSGSWLGEAGSEVQEFTSSGTWTKPAKGTMAFAYAVGGGGAGARGGSTDAGGGGGGGSYATRALKLSDLPSTVVVTVGAGGAAVTTDDTNGNAGGNSSFGSYLTAYGGGGGGHGSNSVGGPGGGGGGVAGAGTSGSGTTPGTGGKPTPNGTAIAADTDSTFGGGGGATGDDNGRRGGDSVHGGGGGGSGRITGAAAGNGGSSIYGGGGGGGASDLSSDAPGSGGTSVHSGAGGAGAYDSNNATAGVQPGGGGGGSESGNSGKGGDGFVRVVVV